MSNVLSQEEIDALLGGLSGGQIDAGGRAQASEGEVTTFDFTDQDRFMPGRLPTLETIHDRFARLFRMQLSTTLRRPVEIQISNQMVCSFGDFSRTLEKPSSLHVLRMEPYKGTLLLVLPARLILTLVDYMFGGGGKPINITEDRDFTLIESRVIQKIAEEISRCYTDSWAPSTGSFRPGRQRGQRPVHQRRRRERSGQRRRLQITIENNKATMALCIPYATIDRSRKSSRASSPPTRSSPTTC